MLFNLENDDFFNEYFNLDREVSTPEEGLIMGNMFIDEYIPYKNYKPYKVKPKTEEEALLMKIREFCFAVDDLNLKLDLDPNNKKLFNLFKTYNEKLKMLTKEYEEKYQVLTLDCDNKDRYTWFTGKWPWEGDNKYV